MVDLISLLRKRSVAYPRADMSEVQSTFTLKPGEAAPTPDHVGELKRLRALVEEETERALAAGILSPDKVAVEGACRDRPGVHGERVQSVVRLEAGRRRRCRSRPSTPTRA